MAKKKLVDRLDRPNIVIVITDQQTWKQNWTPEWASDPENFPAMTELLANGMAFDNAYCNSCTCTSSRTTLFTGKYPAEHGATQVLAFDDPYNDESPPKGYTQMMQGELKNNMENMFQMMEKAGYEVAYKGKWHVSKPIKYVKGAAHDHGISPAIDHLYWTVEDVPHLEKMYGAKHWNYPDAGDDANVYNFGGGDINNDGRIVDGDGHSAWYGEELPGMTKEESDAERKLNSAVNFIEGYKGEKPLFLVVSLVNPHDVLAYPGDETVTGKKHRPLYKMGGYKDEQFENLDVALPITWDEKLLTKPKIQRVWKEMLQGFGEISDEGTAHNYVKFYAFLTSLVDKEISKVLDALKANEKLKNSLIVRISDHGDMAMSHGMLRQKMYSAYQQIINVPMIFAHLSDPTVFSDKSTEAFAGLIDLMPTFAEIAGLNPKEYSFKGKSLVPILDPENPKKKVQNHIHFTFDDNYLVSPEPQNMGACHIRCIVQKEKKTGVMWKYAVYFDPDYGQKMEYEMYNLGEDPHERINLAFKQEDLASPIGQKRQELHELLTKVMLKKGTMPYTIAWPEVSGGPVGDNAPLVVD
jgi:arylsulfatase A-like enzyme